MEKIVKNKQRLVTTNLKMMNQGFSLVELMVGLLISLLVAFVAVGYLVSSSRTLTYQNSNDLIQENARFAFELIASESRLAGLNEVGANGTIWLNSATDLLVDGISAQAVCNNDLGEVSAVGSSLCNANNLTYSLGGTANIVSDRFALMYAQETGTTCTGQDITSFQRILSVYWVADLDNDGVPSLYCQAYSSTPNLVTKVYNAFTLMGARSPLVDGIETLQVLYGVDTDGDQQVDSYSDYGSISAANRRNVLSAKIGLMVNSGQIIDADVNSLKTGDTTLDSRTLTVLGESFTRTDRVARTTLATSIQFPNLPLAILP